MKYVYAIVSSVYMVFPALPGWAQHSLQTIPEAGKTISTVSKGSTQMLDVASKVTSGIACARFQAPYNNPLSDEHINPSDIIRVITPQVLTTTKVDLPERAPAKPTSTYWAASETLAHHLTTLDTDPSLNILIKTISANIDMAEENMHTFTQIQRMRVEAAKKYFFSLTPQQANDPNTFLTPLARRHASVLRAPQATEYGYYIQGGNLKNNVEPPNTLVERGYIPTFIGDPTNGFSPEDLKHMIENADQTDRPIFVFMDVHGGVFLGEFEALAGGETFLSTNQIVDYMQQLRTKTKTPKVNLYLTACHGGAFLREFERLPASQRTGINVFVTVGTQQVSYPQYARSVRTHIVSADITHEQVKKMIEHILSGHIFGQAYIDGELFNPLQLAVEKSASIPNLRFARKLKYLLKMQNTMLPLPPRTRKFLENKLQDEILTYYIARVANDEVARRWGHPALSEKDFSLNASALQRTFAKKQGITGVNGGTFEYNDDLLQWNKTLGLPQSENIFDLEDLDAEP